MLGPIQNPRSKTPGRRPGDGVFRQISDGEVFINQADGLIIINDSNGQPITYSLVSPTAPTRPLGEASTRVANMQALANAIGSVNAAVTALVGGVPPATLSTIKQIADSLGDDPTAFSDLTKSITGTNNSVATLAASVLSFANAQSLSPAQKQQALANMGAQGDLSALGTLWSSSGATSSIGGTGYMTLPPGSDGRRLIMQWVLAPGGLWTWAFPTAFPNAVFGGFATPYGTYTSPVSIPSLNDWSQAQVTVSSQTSAGGSSPVNAFVMAFGF